MRGPQVVCVDLGTLRCLHEALDGEATAPEVEELRADLDYLIDQAEWNGEPL